MKRSALYHRHGHAGARFAEYHGWQLPSRFSISEDEADQVTAAAGLADLSYRAKFETTIEPPRHWWRLAAGRYLVIDDPPLDVPPAAIDVTSVYSNLLLAGPRGRDILAKLTSLNTSDERLPNQSVASASVGHVHCIVLREDLPRVPAWHLLVTRDYAESFWDAILHAGHEFHLQPFGMDALERLRG